MPAVVASALTCLKKLSLLVGCAKCQNCFCLSLKFFLIIPFFLFISIFDRIDQRNQAAWRYRPAFAKLCMSYFSEAEHQVGPSAIYYILVIVGIQINNRLDSRERHASWQFAFERQSEGIDLNHRDTTWVKNLLKGSQISLIKEFALQELAAASRLGKPWQYCDLSSAGIPSTLPEPLFEIQIISSNF